MGGRYLEAVRQARELVANAVVLALCELHLGVFAQQVRTTEGSDKQEVPTQEYLRHIHRPGHLVNKIGHVFRRVARGMHRFDAYGPHVEALAMLDRSVVVFHVVQLAFVIGRQHQLCIRPLGELFRPRRVVGVDMGFEHMGDAQFRAGCPVEVSIRIALRIDNCSLARAGTADAVGIVRQVGHFESLEQHCYPPPV